jgi:hypothetical protein
LLLLRHDLPIRWPFRIQDLSRDASLHLTIHIKSLVNRTEPQRSISSIKIPIFDDSIQLKQRQYFTTLPLAIRGPQQERAAALALKWEDEQTERLFTAKLSSDFDYFMSSYSAFIEILFPSFDEPVLYEDIKFDLVAEQRQALETEKFLSDEPNPKKDPIPISMLSLLQEILKRDSNSSDRFSWFDWTQKLASLPFIEIKNYIYQLAFLLRTYDLSTELELAHQTSIVSSTPLNTKKPAPGNPLELFLNSICTTGSLALATSYYWILFSQCEDSIYGSLYSKILNAFLTLLDQVYSLFKYDIEYIYSYRIIQIGKWFWIISPSL